MKIRMAGAISPAAKVSRFQVAALGRITKHECFGAGTHAGASTSGPMG
jgi:hypothetical protein